MRRLVGRAYGARAGLRARHPLFATQSAQAGRLCHRFFLLLPMLRIGNAPGRQAPIMRRLVGRASSRRLGRTALIGGAPGLRQGVRRPEAAL